MVTKKIDKLPFDKCKYIDCNYCIELKDCVLWNKKIKKEVKIIS